MPTWTNHVPEKETKYAYKLTRTPSDRPLKAIILSDDFYATYTHWWKGRTRPCDDENCEACQENTPARFHAYVACMNPATHETFIFETTANAAKALETYRASFGTLRGCLFHASRPARRRNAAVELLTRPADLNKITLPKSPDVIKAMSVIWQIPANAIQTTTTPRTSKQIHIDPTIIDKTRDPAENSNDKPKRLSKKDLDKCVPQ